MTSLFFITFEVVLIMWLPAFGEEEVKVAEIDQTSVKYTVQFSHQ